MIYISFFILVHKQCYQKPFPFVPDKPVTYVICYCFRKIQENSETCQCNMFDNYSLCCLSGGVAYTMNVSTHGLQYKTVLWVCFCMNLETNLYYKPIRFREEFWVLVCIHDLLSWVFECISRLCIYLHFHTHWSPRSIVVCMVLFIESIIYIKKHNWRFILVNNKDDKFLLISNMLQRYFSEERCAFVITPQVHL